MHDDRELSGDGDGRALEADLLPQLQFSFSHFPDKETDEVDIVLEDREGRIVGLEIKASARVRSEDFAGLRKLAKAAGSRFAFGAVLYDHEQIVHFGDHLAAAPLSTLWA